MGLPTDAIGDGFTRTYVGKVNNCISGKGSLYHYRQLKQVNALELPEIIPIIDEKNFSDEFKHKANLYQRKILATVIPKTTENVKYDFEGMFYMMKDSVESTQPMYKFNENTFVQ